MKHRLFLKEEATKDVDEAFQYYENRKPGLGDDFLKEVKEYLQKISENPSMFRSGRGRQIANLRKFPFKIIYRIKHHEIIVYSIFHHSRNPDRLTRHDQS